jgi:hypothetical protein
VLARAHGQCDQEPLELDDAAADTRPIRRRSDRTTQEDQVRQEEGDCGLVGDAVRCGWCTTRGHVDEPSVIVSLRLFFFLLLLFVFLVVDA